MSIEETDNPGALAEILQARLQFFGVKNLSELPETQRLNLEYLSTISTIRLISDGRTIATVIKEKHPEKEIYFVGGTVRNYLLKEEIKDIDLTGNVDPQLVANLFSGASITDKMGTVFIPYEQGTVEYTPYRVEGDYNGRRPENVKFSENIHEDATRRDFTINAIYLNPFTLEVIDFVGGLKDLKNRELRCVGEANGIFRDDYLRILRAIRFSCAYGLKVDPPVLDAIQKNMEQVSKLSGFRLRGELLGGIAIPGYMQDLCELGLIDQIIPEVSKMRGMDQKTRHHKHDVLEHSLESLEFALKHEKGRRKEFYVAVFMHDIGKPVQFAESRKYKHGTAEFNKARSENEHSTVGLKLAESILGRLNFSNNEIKYVSKLIKFHNHPVFYEETVNQVRDSTIKRLITEMGEDLDDLVALARSDRFGTGTRTYEEVLAWSDAFNGRVASILAKGEPKSLKDLAINGNHIMELGYKGREVGTMLNQLYEHILEKPSDNNKERLVELVHSMARQL
jgi:tRNA nucleotidyltransferase (CCA-adding enzyme)